MNLQCLFKCTATSDFNSANDASQQGLKVNVEFICLKQNIREALISSLSILEPEVDESLSPGHGPEHCRTCQQEFFAVNFPA